MNRTASRSIRLLQLITFLTLGALAFYVSWAYWANTNPANKELAKRSMIVSGYSDVVIGAYRFWGCPKGDIIHFAYSAKGPTGIPIKGTVCGDLFTKEFTARH